MFELDYKPVVNEVPPVAEAIRLMRQVTTQVSDGPFPGRFNGTEAITNDGVQSLVNYLTATSPPDVDTRWSVGYAEGVAYAMGIFDPWCDDHGDPVLWSTCAAMHDARPATDERAPLRRKAAWFEYIRMAAELTAVAS